MFEYLQEVQVKTGGISAEYGGALGGVISAVTKSGGNAYRGEAHYYFTGASTSASPVERLVLNPADDITVNYFQDEEQPNDRHDIGGSIGGPILRDKLFFFGSWAPRYVRRRTTTSSPATRPAPSSQKQTINSAFGKVNYDPSNRLRTSFSVLWTPTTSEGTLPAYNGAAPNTISSSKASNENQKTRGFEIPQISYSGTLDFTLSNSSLLSVRGGMFDDNYRDTGVPLISSVSYQTSNISGAPLGYPDPGQPARRRRLPEHARVCSCRSRIAPSARYGQVDYIQAFNAKGNHNLKAGFGIQHTSNTVDNTYPGGGYVFVWWDNAFTSSATGLTDRGPYGYYEVNDFGTRGEASADILSLYVQDQWSINNLTLNLGLRTEREVIPSFRTGHQGRGVQVQLRRQAGAAHRRQLRRAGRWPLQGLRQLGPLLRLDEVRAVSRGGFGGDIWRVQYRSLDTTDVFSLSGTNLPGRNLWTPEAGSFRDRRVPNFDTVDPEHQADEPGRDERGLRVSAQGQPDADASTTRTATCAGRSRIWACSKTATRSTSTSTPARASRRRWCRRA